MNDDVGISIIARDMASGALSRVRGEMAGLGVAAREGNVATGVLGRGLGAVGTAAAGVGGAFSTLRNRVGQLASGIGVLGGGAGILGLGYVLAGSISKARDFAQAMELIHTQAGGTQAEVQNMTRAVMGLAGQVGTAPNALAAGLYHIESAGLRGARALEILRIAAEGAKVGNADLESVTNALIASVNSGIKGTTDMSQAMGVLNAVVGAGNMRMQDLTDAFSTGILSSARAFGISIQSVGSAIADMTNQGVPAIDAATRLRMTISLLGAPTSKAASELKRIGLNSTELAVDMRGPGGILAAVQDLKDHLDKSGLSAVQQAALISHAFGGGRSSSAILTLLGSLDKFRTIQDQVTAGTGKFGEAWDATTHTAAYKIENFGAIADAVLIKIGNKILPQVADALGGLGNWFDAHGDDIANFFGGALRVGQQVGGLIGGIVGQFQRLPGWLKDILITGFVGDRVIKFALGFDPIVLGAKLGAGLLGPLVGGIGGWIGKLIGSKAVPQLVVGAMAGAVPVFVTGMAPGLNLLGGGGGAVTAAEEAAGGAGAADVGAGLLGGASLGALAATAAAGAAVLLGLGALFALTTPEGQGYKRPGPRQTGTGPTDPYGYGPKGQLRGPSGTAGDPLHVTIPTSTPVGAGLANLAHGYGMLAGHVPGSAITQSHRPVPPPTLTPEQFLARLRATAFIGAPDYKSIFERFTTFRGGGRGTDPTGQGFLALVEQLKNPKAPAVMFEIRGHLAELKGLEKYYLDHGDIPNALKVQGVINEVDRLIGVTHTENAATKAAQAQTKASIERTGANNAAHLTRLGVGMDRTAAETAALNRKRWAITVNSPPVYVHVDAAVASASAQGYVPVSQGGTPDYSGKNIPLYQQGAWEIFGNTLALLHDKEMVIPPEPAEALRRAMARGENLMHPLLGTTSAAHRANAAAQTRLRQAVAAGAHVGQGAGPREPGQIAHRTERHPSMRLAATFTSVLNVDGRQVAAAVWRQEQALGWGPEQRLESHF